MPNLRELDVFVEEDGQRKPFTLLIEAPVKSPGAEDYFCCIHAPELFKKEKNIHGVDATQASELAIKFVKDMLAGKRLIDKDGKTINL